MVLKRVFLGILLVFGLANADLVEGKDYVVLPEPIENAQNSLIKVYSYDCPVCYKYDKLVIPKLLDGMEIELKPYHLATQGPFGLEASQILAINLAKDLKNGVAVTDENSAFKTAQNRLYASYHEKKERFGEKRTPEGVKAFLAANSALSEEEFAQNLQDEKVKEILATWGVDEKADALKIALVQGSVPAFLVDGKYLILTQSIENIDDFRAKIRELHEKN